MVGILRRRRAETLGLLQRGPSCGLLLFAAIGFGCGGETQVEPSANQLLCYASCDQQKRGCAALDLEGCRGLCDYVVADLEEKAGCIDKARPTWQCGKQISWTCHSETNLVGMPKNPSDCSEEFSELHASGCQPL